MRLLIYIFKGIRQDLSTGLWPIRKDRFSIKHGINVNPASVFHSIQLQMIFGCLSTFLREISPEIIFFQMKYFEY
jgi:hypothetical protein